MDSKSTANNQIKPSESQKDGQPGGSPGKQIGKEQKELVRKRSMDDREDDEDLFENPVSIEKLAPLSSISEVSLHVEHGPQEPDVVDV